MFDYIKTAYKKGDKIRLTCVNGEFSGEIIFIGEDSIILKTLEGKTCGIKGSEISFFEEIELSGVISQEEVKPETQETDNASPISQSVLKEETIVHDKQQSPPTTGTPLTNEPNNLSGTETMTEEHVLQVETFAKKETKYKPGDVIPLQELHRIDPKTKNNKIVKKQKPTTMIGLESLRTLVAEEHAIQNEKYVPAMGEVKFAKPESQFGFIKDGITGKELYFNFNQIVDDSISKSSGSMFHMPVVYSIQGNDRGDMAITIHRPNKVSDLIKLAQELTAKGDVKPAIRVLDHILDEYPDNFTADEFKGKLVRNQPKTTPRVFNNPYSKANKYKIAKDYSKAIEFYIKAIEEEDKLETSIKDLGMLYAQLYKMGGDDAEQYRQKVIDLMDEHEQDLPNTISTLYYLENLYYSVQDFEAFIDVASELLERKELQKDKTRSSQLLCKIAAAYIKLDDIETALIKIDEATSLDPNNVGASKLRQVIEENESASDIKAAISATEFEILISGLSSFIQKTLNDYNEYSGVPSNVIESGSFNESHLKAIRALIDRFSGRPKDRSKYLLTEAKLIQEIDPNNIIQLRTVLARYCNAMALNSISDNSSMDITRFYYNEAFSLEEKYEKVAPQVALYLLTHSYTYDVLLNASKSSPSVDEALKTILMGDFDAKKWESILTAFLYNREITAQITSKLYTNANYRRMSLDALKSFGIDFPNIQSKDDFVEAWNRAREKRLGDYKKTSTSLLSIRDVTSLEEILFRLTKLQEERHRWMTSLDLSRITEIITNIAPAIDTYLRSTGYRNKEANYNNIRGQVQRLIQDIQEGPTKMSFDALLPVLNHIQSVLFDSFSDVIKMSEPRISAKLLSDAVIEEGNIVSIQVEISNHKDSSPIREVSVSIVSTESIDFITNDNTLYNAIDGGEAHIFKLKLKVGEDVIKNKTALLELSCNYKSGDVEKTYQSKLSLKLYSPDEFELIENPYAPYADGGPVPIDSNMFYGREEFISNITHSILNSPSKQIIIYGQKRCGKSSVMSHLKKQLEDTGKTFCISFSLGDISGNLSEASFYYKILSTIKDNLDSLEFNDVVVPTYDIPTFTEFKQIDDENPLNTFSKYIVRFKQACMKTEGWKDKSLVVMIDEFTYLYTEIKKGHIKDSIMKQWKAITQNERAQFSVVLVGQDVVPSFKKEDYARNAFGVIQDIRLTYLQLEPARNLIEKPILKKNGESRYIGKAVDTIIEYTSRNPYYIQIFCNRLVDFMNRNKSISVTEADVNEVARSFIIGDQALDEDKFDNLIRAGELKDYQEFPEKDILEVLRRIALCTKNVPYCNRSDIETSLSVSIVDSILKHLEDREVIERKGEDNYKIQVKLFQEWLLNH